MKAAHRLLRGQRAFESALLAVVLDRYGLVRRALETSRVGHCQRNGHTVIALLRVVMRRVGARCSHARAAVTKVPLIARDARIVPR